MTPLIVYMTRPEAYEVFMGGKRDIRMWVQEPAYSHASRSYEVVGKQRYVDRGWHAPHTSGVLARDLLKQDKELLEAVWKEIFWSILPQGMTYEDGYEWADTITKPDPEFPVTNYHLLTDDKEWEGKCNVCHKRFLLKVDLRSNQVERVIPHVELRRRSTDEPLIHGWVTTDQASFIDATEYWHAELGPDDIPF